MNLSRKVAVNTVLLTGSRALVAASGLVGVLVSTRYLGRDDFGKLTVAIVFASLFGFLTDSGLWLVAAREIARKPESEDHIASNIFTIGLLLSAATVTLSLGVMFIAYGSDQHLIREAILILSIQMLFTAPAGTSGSLMTAHQQAVPIAVAGAVSSAVFIVCLTLVVTLGLGFAGVAATFTIGGVASALTPAFFVLRHRRIRLSYDHDLWHRLVRSTLPQSGVLVINLVYFRIDLILLSLLKAPSDAAIYGIAYKVVEVLILVPVFLMQTLFPEIARAPRHSQRLAELVEGSFSTIIVMLIPVLVIFVSFAPEAIWIAGGPAFSQATPVLQLVTVALALSFMNAVFFTALVALNEQRRLFTLLIGVLATNVILNLALIPPLGARGAGGALIASEVVLLILGRRLYRSAGELPRTERPARLATAAAAAAAAALGVRGFDLPAQGAVHTGILFGSHVSPILTFAIGAPVTVIVFLLVLHAVDGVPRSVRLALANLRQRPSEPSSPPEPVSS